MAILVNADQYIENLSHIADLCGSTDFFYRSHTNELHLNDVEQGVLDAVLSNLPESFASADEVNAERDRRINAGFSVDFGGGVIKPFDSTQDARDNISGVHSFALAAIVGGAQQGNLRWANPDADFEWICADNSKITMDAFTAREFAEAAMEYKSAIIFAARVVKDMGTIPENYADDQYWPSSTLTLG